MPYKHDWLVPFYRQRHCWWQGSRRYASASLSPGLGSSYHIESESPIPLSESHTSPKVDDTPWDPSLWRDRGTRGKAFLRSPWVSHEVGTYLHPAGLAAVTAEHVRESGQFVPVLTSRSEMGLPCLDGSQPPLPQHGGKGGVSGSPFTSHPGLGY